MLKEHETCSHWLHKTMVNIHKRHCILGVSKLSSKQGNNRCSFTYHSVSHEIHKNIGKTEHIVTSPLTFARLQNVSRLVLVRRLVNNPLIDWMAESTSLQKFVENS